MRSMSNQISSTNSYSTSEGLFTVGERVLYSDLSPWEIAEIVGFRFSVELDQVVVDLKFSDGLCEDCMTCGLRKLNRTNYKKYMDPQAVEAYPVEDQDLEENLEDWPYSDEEYAELLA